MSTALYLALIIISAAIIGLVLLQGKGSLGGGIFGGDSMYSKSSWCRKNDLQYYRWCICRLFTVGPCRLSVCSLALNRIANSE